jgi:hypothetical protein
MSFQYLREGRAFCALSSLFLVFGCGSVKASVGPNGAHRIVCGNGMSACVAKADKLCRDKGYTIVKGVSRPKMLGGTTSAYRTRSEVGELNIFCGLPDEEAEEQQTIYKLPPRTDEPVPEASQEDPAETGTRVCTPGATQACVGPGACSGGQVCLDSGKAYGACDCGDVAPKSQSEARPREKADGPSSTPGSGPSEQPVIPGKAPDPTPLRSP